MKKLATAALVAAGLVTAVCGTAQAREWYILDFGKGVCTLSPQGITPDIEVQWMRSSPQFLGPPNVDVIHDTKDGSVLGVNIVGTYQAGNQVQMLFATSMSSCNGALKWFVEQGQVVNRAELQ
jgi:hypothetical protein